MTENSSDEVGNLVLADFEYDQEVFHVAQRLFIEIQVAREESRMRRAQEKRDNVLI